MKQNQVMLISVVAFLALLAAVSFYWARVKEKTPTTSTSGEVFNSLSVPEPPAESGGESVFLGDGDLLPPPPPPQEAEEFSGALDSLEPPPPPGS